MTEITRIQRERRVPVRLVFPTAWGWMGLCWTEAGVRRLVFDCESPAEVWALLTAGESLVAAEGRPSKSWAAGAADLQQQLVAHTDGELQSFADVLLDMSGLTEFQRQVTTACRQIPLGTTLTYAALASRAGRPRAARAAGSVMSRNRWPLLVPCHRVVGSHGGLGGFSSRGGLATKRRLLQLESIAVDRVASA